MISVDSGIKIRIQTECVIVSHIMLSSIINVCSATLWVVKNANRTTPVRNAISRRSLFLNLMGVSVNVSLILCLIRVAAISVTKNYQDARHVKP